MSFSEPLVVLLLVVTIDCAPFVSRIQQRINVEFGELKAELYIILTVWLAIVAADSSWCIHWLTLIFTEADLCPFHFTRAVVVVDVVCNVETRFTTSAFVRSNNCCTVRLTYESANRG